MNLLFTSILAPALLRAYGETHHRVDADSPDQAAFVLRIGEVSKPLAGTHKKHGVDCSAYITACNPWSEAHSEAKNAIRQDKLLQVLQMRSLRWMDGIGQHPNNQWLGEPSVLILGLSLAAAKVLAKDFEQNAFVWSGLDARPQLVLLR